MVLLQEQGRRDPKASSYLNVGPRLRPIDLARIAGVSVQTVRRYESGGLLPPSTRLPSGHRRFDERHVAALLATNELTEAHGHAIAVRFMRHAIAGRVGDAVSILDEAHAEIHGLRHRVHVAAKTMESVGREPPRRRASQSGVGIGAFSELLGVAPSVIRFWEEKTLLDPPRNAHSGYRVFGERELVRAKLIRRMRDAGFGFGSVRAVLECLDDQRPDDARRIVLSALDTLSARSAASYQAAGHVLQLGRSQAIEPSGLPLRP